MAWSWLPDLRHVLTPQRTRQLARWFQGDYSLKLPLGFGGPLRRTVLGLPRAGGFGGQVDRGTVVCRGVPVTAAAATVGLWAPAVRPSSVWLRMLKGLLREGSAPGTPRAPALPEDPYGGLLRVREVQAHSRAVPRGLQTTWPKVSAWLLPAWARGRRGRPAPCVSWARGQRGRPAPGASCFGRQGCTPRAPISRPRHAGRGQGRVEGPWGQTCLPFQGRFGNLGSP